LAQTDFIMSYKRILVLIIALISAVLAYAWIDGGEESLRPIAQPVSAPLEQIARMPEPAR
jgi:hypothetical protein